MGGWVGGCVGGCVCVCVCFFSVSFEIGGYAERVFWLGVLILSGYGYYEKTTDLLADSLKHPCLKTTASIVGWRDLAVDVESGLLLREGQCSPTEYTAGFN